MFSVVGDIVEYDGKPFAVIIAPLTGDRIDAVDALNNKNFLSGYDAEQMLDEVLSDTTKLVNSEWPSDVNKRLKDIFRRAVLSWVRSR